jgi:hypothetical protein
VKPGFAIVLDPLFEREEDSDSWCSNLQSLF